MDCNDAFCRYMGYERDEIVETSVTMFALTHRYVCPSWSLFPRSNFSMHRSSASILLLKMYPLCS